MNKLKHHRILLIEDNALDQKAFKTAAADYAADFEYDIASSIAEASSLLSSQKYEVVIADYSLGDGNAFDIVDKLGDIPFILTTGNGDEAIAARAIKKGAFDYIVKDFERNFSKLLPVSVMKALKWRATQEELSLFEASVLNANDAIIIAKLVDGELEISFVNAAFTAMTGFQSKEVLGNSLYFLVGEQTSENQIQAVRSALLEFKEYNAEILLYKKNLQSFWASMSLVPLTKHDEFHLVAIVRDISEQKRVENELKKAKQAAEKARLTEQRFLISVSHEIRTPMNAILGMSHLLGETKLSSKQEEYLQALKYSGDNLMNLISDILDLTKIQANEVEVVKEQFNLFELMLDLQRNFAYQQKDKDLAVVVDLDISISNDVIGDGNRLKQILTNLLSNASKFTEKGEIGIKVSLKEEKGSDYVLEFQVFDTGIGISKDEMSSIFNNFSYGNDKIHKEFGGSGLGLSIAKKLVELLGGEIWIKSEINQGTVVYFTLPLQNSGVLSAVKTHQPHLSQTDEELLQSLKILVAEDNFMNQKLISGLLSRWKCHFDIANNGEEAVEQFKKLHYDVVFMDINMPIMNGYEAAKMIRNSTSNFRVPIVALTAAVLSTEKEKVFLAGMSEYISKPFSPKKLKETVLKLARTSQKDIPELIKKADTITKTIHKKNNQSPPNKKTRIQI